MSNTNATTAEATTVTAKQKARRRNEYEYNPFDDDEVIESLCNLENPESCESCT